MNAYAELSRRGFLGNIVTGLSGVGMIDLLSRSALANEAAPQVQAPHFPPKAKRVLQVFCPGAASHMDLWDYKPSLEKMAGQPLPGEENFLSFQGKNGNLMPSPWAFKESGQCGKPITTMLPHLSQHADEIAFIHSMHSKTNTHGPGCVFMNTGHTSEGFPSAGAWLSYALGSANQNLPTYVAIPDVRGEPPNGKANWSNGFLPARHQAIVMSDQQPIRNLARPDRIAEAEDAAARALVAKLNRDFADQYAAETELQARVAAYELAARMQMSAPEVSNLASETEATHQRYGTSDANPLKAAYARNCLLARRLLERGVRYVNLYCASRASGVDGLLNWDAHKTLKPDYERHCPILDQPTAALLTDLKQSGLLEDTLVLWTTEFGRMPTHQAGTTGRDHNPDGFTCWMMGAGVKGGVSYGATDEFGRRAEVNPTTVWDFYATVLHLLGFDHEKLTIYHNGLDRRLTDVHGHVIKEILA
ncbi:DUF1501 domain-containing protein [Blastopirellula sp. JC732]|uniref:DUF1501 domain-containing protein n=1 Tax=Blastopirellula sediminis TaxID=2894196 RepID=A0A9X1MPC5_9BACT|nr:DUF1501 domain-containing protein [Blastopirellula sediminis]MCC9607558.1 DUF1501 domain-containing protein [Blastopirellula sediminis]MCC9629149.1 DUF1501 domain-containing protein [Blastopirellula sediminis]